MIEKQYQQSLGITAIIVSLFLLSSEPALSDEETREARLDRLFSELAAAPDEATAKTIENQIWVNWLQSGDTEIDTLMADAIQRRRQYDFGGALEVLNTVVAKAPDYAEGWNQRAMVNFYLRNYEASLADIAETLKREPRHFGALAGRGIIRFQQGKPALAYQSIITAMKIYPFIPERSMVPDFNFQDQ